jgi:hypothetical protein
LLLLLLLLPLLLLLQQSDGAQVDPFDENSPIKQAAIEKFPPDMFFVLRVVQLLRGMANGEPAGLAVCMCVCLKKVQARQAAVHTACAWSQHGPALHQSFEALLSAVGFLLKAYVLTAR